MKVMVENRSQAPVQVDWSTYIRDYNYEKNLVEFLVYARRGFEPANRNLKKIITDVYESGSKILPDEKELSSGVELRRPSSCRCFLDCDCEKEAIRSSSKYFECMGEEKEGIAETIGKSSPLKTSNDSAGLTLYDSHWLSCSLDPSRRISG